MDRQSRPSHLAPRGDLDPRTVADVALKILDGFDYRQLPRYGEVTKNDPGNASIDRGAVAHEQDNEAKQAAWLKKKGLFR